MSADRDPLRLLVVACPHSGTKYLAELLTKAGLPCGHEARFNLAGLSPATKAAEVSWVAAHYLGSAAIGPRTYIVHQVREPLAWLNSWSRTRNAHAAWQHLEKTWPGYNYRREQHAVCSAMELWVAMNYRIERATGNLHRVEDLAGELGIAIVDKLLALAGVIAPVRDVTTGALERVSRTINHHPSLQPRLTWESLPRGGARDAFVELAKRYGYDVPG